MSFDMQKNSNPLDAIDVSFGSYLNRRKTSEEKHLVNGIPDYAFSLDYELREKILQIPHFYSISKKIMSTYVSQEIQILNQRGLAVGPNQFPDIYQMGLDCSKRLGIGIPNIFVLNNSVMNAYTIATDDVSPMVVLFSGIIERLSPEELKCVIAHECGHIHNNHTVFQTVVNAVLNCIPGTLGAVLSVANKALMTLWTRAAEVTSDRAAVICADNIESAYSTNGKLLYGGILGRDYDINYEALKKQLDDTLKNPSKIYEFSSDHPSAPRRIFAEMAFAESDVYYKWRPDMKLTNSKTVNWEETEEKCKKLVNIFDNK